MPDMRLPRRRWASALPAAALSLLVAAGAVPRRVRRPVRGNPSVAITEKPSRAPEALKTAATWTAGSDGPSPYMPGCPP
ncbi:hypothetical protein [Streptomyces sp. NPDC058613]|uniref:hypothetical protein n=1 Tax=Streptomyces sp. NPDC058613 TaxID=3346556 RepID=UPI003659ECA9